MTARWEWWIGLGGSLAAISVLAVVLDWSTLADAASRLSIGAISAAALVSLLLVLLLAWRWVALASAVVPIDRKAAFRAALVGQALNTITPAALGSDVYRVVLAPNDLGRTRTAMLVIVERILGLSAYGLAYLAGFFAAWSIATAPPAFTLAAIMFALFALMPLPLLLLKGSATAWLLRLLSDRLRQVVRSILTARRAGVFAAYALSLAGVFAWIAAVVILAASAGLQLPLGALAAITIATEFSRLLPISVQGVGVREATFGWLTTLAGGTMETAVIVCLVAYALHFGMCVALALVERSISRPRHGGHVVL